MTYINKFYKWSFSLLFYCLSFPIFLILKFILLYIIIGFIFTKIITKLFSKLILLICFHHSSSFYFFLFYIFKLFLQSLLLYCFFYSHWSFSYLFTIHLFNRFFHLLFTWKFNITYSNTLHRKFFSYNSYTFYFPNLFKSIPNLLILYIMRKITNKYCFFIINFKLLAHSNSDIMLIDFLAISRTCISSLINSRKFNISIHRVCTFLIFL